MVFISQTNPLENGIDEIIYLGGWNKSHKNGAIQFFWTAPFLQYYICNYFTTILFVAKCSLLNISVALISS